MKKPFFKDGLYFQCTQCSHCCRHDPGFVFLNEKDILRLSKYFSMSPADFVHKKCRLIPAEGGFKISLKEKANYDCEYWEDGGCQIYEVRPLQCSTYPFWPAILENEDNWNSEKEHCPGMRGNQKANHDSVFIEKTLKTIKNSRFIFPPEHAFLAESNL